VLIVYIYVINKNCRVDSDLDPIWWPGAKPETYLCPHDQTTFFFLFLFY